MNTYRIQKNQLSSNINSCRVLVVDSMPIIYFAIKKLTHNHSYIDVVDYCDNNFTIASSYNRKKPNLLIIDPDIPLSANVIKQLKRKCNEIKFILYMNSKSQTCIDEFIRIGVNGVVFKSSDVKMLLAAIQSVNQGVLFIDQALTPHIKNSSLLPNDIEKQNILLPKISPREKQIFKLIIDGLRNREIADILSISIKTVESHRLNLMKKLDAHNIVDLIKWAPRLNIE